MPLAITAWIVLIALLLVRSFFGWPSRFWLLEHQRGILFRRGVPMREVGAGRHTVWIGAERILFVDTRPISVSFENRAVTLTDSLTAVYGFSGSAEICDVTKALYSAANYPEMPAFVLLCCARLVLNRHDSVGLVARQAAITDEVVDLANPRLAAAGFRLLTFRMTQLSVVGPASPSKAN